MSTPNRITKVAIVGAGGNCGGSITSALLKAGKHSVTAITRIDSESKLPDGVIQKKVDYNKPETLVEAFRGQDALVITLGGHAIQAESALVKAAAEAGVQWILPNEWSPDTANEALVEDVSFFQPKIATRKAIEDLGKSHYIAVSTGFWYEWIVAMTGGFGIDFKNHTFTVYDEGETKISTATLPQVGRAVAALLALPVKSEGANPEACLESLKDKVVYVSSFTVSQKEVFQSALRVTGTHESDWTIAKEATEERYSQGVKELKEGNFSGFGKLMSRVFYPDGSGDVEHNKGTINDVLELPIEDMDEATRVAVERAKNRNTG